MGAFDYFLLAFGAALVLLFFLIARKVAVAIGVALICIGVGAYAYVTAQMSHGPARWGSYAVCALSLAAFLIWSFKYVFHMPKIKTTNGCGGVFFETLDNEIGPRTRPRDEL